jgi:septum formation protein
MLLDRLKSKNIILASGSPRRQDLFTELGLPFQIQLREVEEKYSQQLKREEITNYLAELKAKAFEGFLEQHDVLITADTIVWHKNRALEKPFDRSQAIDMLQELSGNNHEVITSVCIKTSTTQKIIFDTTKVYFKKLSENEINFYVDKYKPFDKAGAYGIQEWIGFIGIPKIEGSYFNVMGLPVHKLYEELLKM